MNNKKLNDEEYIDNICYKGAVVQYYSNISMLNMYNTFYLIDNILNEKTPKNFEKLSVEDIKGNISNENSKEFFKLKVDKLKKL